MKVCRECNIEKPLTEYYAHKGMADGHLNKCKSCVQSRVASHRKLNIEKIALYDQKRSKTNHRKQWRKAKYNEQLKADPTKFKARWTLRNAIRDGKLIRGMCACGEIGEAHHDDYSKPLDVIWLCKKHHLEIHNKVQCLADPSKKKQGLR